MARNISEEAEKKLAKKGYQRVVINFEYVRNYDSNRSLVEERGAIYLEHSGGDFIFLIESADLASIVQKERKGLVVDPSLKGVVRLFYTPKGRGQLPRIAKGEAYQRHMEDIENARSRHLLLSAFPSEVTGNLVKSRRTKRRASLRW